MYQRTFQPKHSAASLRRHRLGAPLRGLHAEINQSRLRQEPPKPKSAPHEHTKRHCSCISKVINDGSKSQRSRPRASQTPLADIDPQTSTKETKPEFSELPLSFTACINRHPHENARTPHTLHSRMLNTHDPKRVEACLPTSAVHRRVSNLRRRSSPV